MQFDLQKNWPLLVAGLAVVGAIFFIMQPGTQSTSYQTITPTSTTDPNASQTAAANLAAAQQTQQLEFNAFGQIANIAAQEDMAALSLKDDAMKYAGADYLGTLQADVLKTQYSDQLAAAQAADHTSQQNAFWGGLFSFLSADAQAAAAGG